MVSHHFCAALCASKVSKTYDVQIFGEEPQAAYDRVHLTDYFKARDLSALSLSAPEWYSKNNFKLNTNCRIVSIDPIAKTVRSDSGQDYEYDKLIIATGSTPFIPPVPGTDKPGVFVYRTIQDAEQIIDFSQGKTSAVVLGGGLLGLEAANALRELGLKSTVVEFANGLMPRQLNEEASSVLESQIRDLGVEILTGKGARAVSRTRSGLEITFNDEDKIETDLLVIATGVRPTDELARDSGLDVGARGGIIVNDRLETSAKDVYAIGECALHRGQVYGFVAPGYQMAEALVESLAGGEGNFKGANLSCRLKLLGIEVSAFGDYLGEGHTLTHRTKDTFRLIVLKRDSLAGGIVVGEWDQTHQLQLAISQERFMTPGEQAEFESRGVIPANDALVDWPSNAIICNCTQTTKGTLSACLSSGCSKVSELSEQTGAGTVCGSCLPLLGQLCGTSGEETAYKPKGSKLLWATAALGAIACALFLTLSPLPAANSVQTAYYQFSQLWQDSFYKQFSGYTMAGLSLLALSLSARKRLRLKMMGNYGWWRAIHSTLGFLCLIALVAHTGFDFGENLNLWLMTCFVLLNLAGSIAGLTVAMEDRFNGPWARRIRSYVTKAHILFFWPYPVLLGFHIYKAYAY